MKIYQLPTGIMIADSDLYEIEKANQYIGLNNIVALNPKELSPSEIEGHPNIILLENNGFRIFEYADEENFIKWEPWMADHIESVFKILVNAHRQGWCDGYEDT